MISIHNKKIVSPLLIAIMVISVGAGSIIVTPKAGAQIVEPWTVELADSSIAGRDSSIALDASGNPHISYLDYDTSGICHNLKYAYKDASGWHIETLGSAYLSAGWAQTSIAIDSAGRPHIAYFDDNGRALYYIHKMDATSWSSRSIHSQAAPSSIYGYCSLALDAADVPHIVYSHGASGLRAFSGPSSDVQISPFQATYPSLVFDTSGHGHYFYYSDDPANRGLRHVSATGNEQVTLSGAIFFISGALDASGNPYVCYSQANAPTSSLRYAYKDTSGWHNEPVDACNELWTVNSLKMDAMNHPHIAWGWSSTGVKHSYKDADGWHTEGISGGAWPALAIDTNGRAHVALNGGEHLSYATKQIQPLNLPPTANAGDDQSVNRWDVVTLDGTKSSDPENQALTYAWSITSAPAGSEATLSTTDPTKPTFTPDKPGAYEIQLIVTDSLNAASQPDTVKITVNGVPAADAGSDQSVHVGTLVTLDGSHSDDMDGTVASYAWTLVSSPVGSNPALSDPTAAKPAFTPDKVGSYVFALKVTDDKGAESTNDAQVTITATNDPPTANAGADHTGKTKSTIQLDGSGSSDPNSDSLTYAWALVTKPPKSKAQISDVTAAKPTLKLDKAGTYKIQLVVTDDHGTRSVLDEMIVTAVNKMPK